jgi:hypothetical protein
LAIGLLWLEKKGLAAKVLELAQEQRPVELDGLEDRC